MTEGPLDSAIRELETFDGSYKKDAIDVLLAAPRSEASENLLAVLRDALENTGKYLDSDDGYHSHVYAAFLLAYFREPRAHELLIRLFSTPEETCDRLFGDVITEDLPALLYLTRGKSVGAIQALVQDESAYVYVRDSAARALTYYATEGTREREETVRFLASVFSEERLKSGEADVQGSFISHLACTLLDLHPEEEKDLILSAFDEGKIDPGIIDRAWAEREFARSSAEKALASIRKEMKHRIPEDFHDWMSGWACFQPERNQENDGDLDLIGDLFADRPYVRESPKIGRNEPCPCGNGKKFKKCCGRAALGI